jgi:hypothetical protein
MKKIYFLLFIGLTIECWGQTESEANAGETIDTLKINTLAINLDLMFNITHNQVSRYPDLKFVNVAQSRYVIKDTEIGFYFRQILDRLENGYLYYNHYLNLSAGMFKYRSLQDKSALLRILYPEPVFIFQNNSARGLSRRYQAGLFFYPVRHFRPDFKINFGLGLLRDWSSWEVNNSAKIEACLPEVRDKILFVNSHLKLRQDLYMDYSEWRPTLFLSFSYQMNNALSLSLFSSYQQSLVSPFNKEIKTAYPDLGKVYPYTYTNMSIGANVYKGLAVKASFIFDYENNNPAIYNSSWEYSLIFGVSWNFTGKKYLPLTFLRK